MVREDGVLSIRSHYDHGTQNARAVDQTVLAVVGVAVRIAQRDHILFAPVEEDAIDLVLTFVADVKEPGLIPYRAFGFTEGPVWDESGFLYVSDESQNKIYRVFLDGRKEEVISLGDPDGNTYDRKHRLIDCASVLRAMIVVTPDGKYKVLADHYQGIKLNSPNDVVIGPDGAIYFTDPTLDLVKGEKQEIPFQGVYRLDDKGKLRSLPKI